MISSTVSRPRCPILHRPSVFWNLLCLSNQSIYADLKLLVLPLHTLASHPYDQPSVLRNQLCLRCQTGTIFAISTCIQSNPSSQASLWYHCHLHCPALLHKCGLHLVLQVVNFQSKVHFRSPRFNAEFLAEGYPFASKL